MFLVNSRLGLFTAAAAGSDERVASPAAASLLPKLRDQYAEFLNHGSPDRLGMLYPPTCVGFGTGAHGAPRAVFLGGMGAAPSHWVLRLASRPLRRADFPTLRPTGFHGGVQNPARLPFPVTARINAARAVRECPPVAHRLRLPASP